MTLLSSFLTTGYVDEVYWSLAVELGFYFLVSLLLAYRLLPHLDLFISLWLSYVVLAGLRLAAPDTLLSALLFPEHAPYFAAGMLFYLLRQPRGRTWRRYTLLAAAYLLAVRASVLQASDMTGAFRATIQPLALALLITGFFGVFYILATRPPRLPRRAWPARLGALTYPLYLLHNSIGVVLFYHFSRVLDKYWLLGGITGLLLGAAYGLHRLVERPLGSALSAYLARRGWPSQP